MEACCYYIQQTNRRISFEYALIKGVNDREQDANELAARIASTPYGCKAEHRDIDKDAKRKGDK